MPSDRRSRVHRYKEAKGDVRRRSRRPKCGCVKHNPSFSSYIYRCSFRRVAVDLCDLHLVVLFFFCEFSELDLPIAELEVRLFSQHRIADGLELMGDHTHHVHFYAVELV